MKSIVFSLLFILSIFLVSQFIFTPAYLYNELLWLDIPMHILGGMAFALLFVSVLNYKTKNIKFLEIILFVAIIGVLWEIYEYIMYIYFEKEWGGVVDTVKDLFNDLLGSSLVYFFNKSIANNQ